MEEGATASTMEVPTRLGAGGRSRSHTHSRKSATQMDPSQFAALSGGNHGINGGLSRSTLEPIQAHHHSTSSTDTVRAMPQQPSNLELPHPPSFSTPNTQRSKSWERRKSVGLPAHLNLEENGYGFPVIEAHGTGNATIHNKWVTGKEVLAAIMVPLPFALESLAYGFGLSPKLFMTTPILEDLGSAAFQAPVETQISLNGNTGLLAITCGVTSLTLLLVGLRGKYSHYFETSGRRKSHTGFSEHAEPLSWALMARKIAMRISAVGLPLYAASGIGIRVALVMLIAMASNVLTQDQRVDYTDVKNIRQLSSRRKCVLATMALQLLFDFSGLTNQQPLIHICLAYVALGLSVFFIAPPYPSHSPRTSFITANAPSSIRSTSAVLSTPWEAPPAAPPSSLTVSSGVSPLICTAEDVTLTLHAGIIAGILSLVLLLSGGQGAGAWPLSSLLWSISASCVGATALLVVDTKSLWSTKGFGALIGSVFSCLTLAAAYSEWRDFAYQSVLISISYVAMKLDDRSSFVSSKSDHSSHTNQKTLSVDYGKVSKFTTFILLRIRGWPLLHSIIVEKDSRRIFYFMCLNFAFMLVQTFYGIATGSLGLLSDSVHMFFDCLALVVGLCAAVMSKWPPSTRFPYGFGKMDTLAGFANGIFLMLISIEIVYEALERLAEGNRIQRLGELLTVSTLGLAVNIVGMAAFGHAHHGHGHGHSHGHEGHSHADHSSLEHSPHDAHSHHDHSHQHHTQHEHSHHDHSHHDHSPHDHNHHDNSHIPTIIHDHSHHNASQGHSPHSHIPNGHVNGHTHEHIHHTSPPSFDIAPLSAVSHYSHLREHSIPDSSPGLSAASSFPNTPSKPHHSHSHHHASDSHGHGHHHHHHHGNENMHGIFLHVLADTLGSVAVVISTLLIHFYGWSGFDPIASCLIAILIFASAVPLVKMSASKLLLTVPEDSEYDLREVLGGIAGLRGVVGYAVPKFWLDEGDDRRTLGSIHVVAGRGSDLEDVKERCIAYMKSRRMDVLVQVEREGAERCWCQSSKQSGHS